MLNMLSRLSIILISGTLAAVAADPLLGTWKVIPESVKPGGNGPKKIVMKFEPGDVAGDVKFTLTGEINEQPYSYTWTATPGGGKFPVEGQTGTQQVEFQRPAENHSITIHYRGGQESARHESTISRDGKVLTTKSRTKTRAGDIVESEAQYQKQ
jgi:hypothetical protein